MTESLHWLLSAAITARLVPDGALALSRSAATAGVWGSVINAAGRPANEVVGAIAATLRIPVAAMSSFDPQVVELLPLRLQRHMGVLPIRRDGKNLIVATSDPFNIELAKEIEFATGMKTIFALASPQMIDQCLRRSKAKKSTNVNFRMFPSPRRLAGLCIREAIQRRASVIEMTVEESGGTLRMDTASKDAVLHLPVPIWRSVLHTLKAVAGLHPGDGSHPQQGCVRYEVDGEPWDLTVATTPGKFGEAARITVVRAARRAALDELGFSDEVARRIRNAIGGTSTVLALVGTNPAVAAARCAVADELLRAGLDVVDLQSSQYPNAAGRIAVVGHVTDSQLADVALAAAIRGHLVVVSMRTRADLDPQMLLGVAHEIVAMDELRRLCRWCAAPIGRMFLHEKRLAGRFSLTPSFRATGCPQCRSSGYSGGIPVAVERAERPRAADMVVKGETTIDEFARVFEPRALEAACA